jgi:hypothetical protein
MTTENKYVKLGLPCKAIMIGTIAIVSAYNLMPPGSIDKFGKKMDYLCEQVFDKAPRELYQEFKK